MSPSRQAPGRSGGAAAPGHGPAWDFRGLVRLCVLLAALVAGVTPALRPAAAGEGARELFARGNSAYEAGRLEEALAAYQQVLAQGDESPELYYNLGNAQLKTGHLGPAILSYRRALRLRPGLADARANLEFARRRTADSQTRLNDDPFPWMTRLRPGADRAALDFVLVLNVAALLFAARRLWRGAPGFLGPLTGVAFGLAALLAVGVFVERRIETQSREGVILDAAADVRTGPGAENTVAFVVHEGTEVSVLRTNGGWTEISLSPELKGWVAASAVESIQ